MLTLWGLILENTVCPEDVEVIRAKDKNHVVGKGTMTLRINQHHGIKACGGVGMEVYLHTLLSFIVDECERSASRFDFFSRGGWVAGTDWMDLRADPDALEKMSLNRARNRLQINVWSSP